jgi:hypothetical protein
MSNICRNLTVKYFACVIVHCHEIVTILVLYHIMSYCTVSYCVLLRCIVLCCVVLCCVVVCYVVSYCSLLCMLDCVLLYCTV